MSLFSFTQNKKGHGGGTVVHGRKCVCLWKSVEFQLVSKLFKNYFVRSHAIRGINVPYFLRRILCWSAHRSYIEFHLIMATT